MQNVNEIPGNIHSKQEVVINFFIIPKESGILLFLWFENCKSKYKLNNILIKVKITYIM